MAKARVASTHALAQTGAEAILDDGGSASDAVVAAILTAGAAHAGVWLGPVVAMVGGVGAGTRLFDGRTCQPGRGEKRPRGFTDEDNIPLAARCAVPRSIAALGLMHAYSTRRPLSALVRSARMTAKQAAPVDDGLDERLTVLEAIPKHGAMTLAQFATSIVRAAGTAAGGLLSPRDLQEARPGDFRPDFIAAGSGELATPCWTDGVESDNHARHVGDTEVVVAADGHGLVAAATFSVGAMGLEVPELGLRLSPTAVPVRRGVPRVTPGTPLLTATPIALLRRATDGWFAAAGVSGADTFDATSLAESTAPLNQRILALRSASGGRTAVIASTERGNTNARST